MISESSVKVAVAGTAAELQVANVDVGIVPMGGDEASEPQDRGPELGEWDVDVEMQARLSPLLW